MFILWTILSAYTTISLSCGLFIIITSILCIDVSHLFELSSDDFDLSYVLFALEPGFDGIYSDFPCRLAASTRGRRGKSFGRSLRPTAGPSFA